MSNLIHFKPKNEKTAEENLYAFIDLCKNEATAFGKTLDFDTDTWIVTDSFDLKAKNHHHRLVFSTLESSATRTALSMAEPFLSFAKGYIRYQHGLRPTKAVAGRLAALRSLECALGACCLPRDPVKCRPDVFNKAAELLNERFSSGVAYRYAVQLEIISDFLSKSGLVAAPFAWKNPLRRPEEGMRVGVEFDKRREQKLPSVASLHALASIFRIASDPADVIVCSAAAIMCAAPDRVNEVLSLQVNCEVTEKIPSSGADAYGLRWWSSKGADPMVKWVVPTMAGVVAEALANIRLQTGEARRIASWYEQNPNSLYLPVALEHFREVEFLTMAEVATIVFAEPVSKDTGRQWCNSFTVATTTVKNRVFAQFSDVESAILRMLPIEFSAPSNKSGQKLSDSLFLVRRNELHSQRTTYRCAIDLMEQGDIYNRLGARSNTGIESIFQKFRFVEDDGSQISLTSHQFRHYLNTLAQAGGMSQLDIAKWSGRKSISQNADYDHVSDRDILAKVRETIGDRSSDRFPKSRTHIVPRITRGEFGTLKLATAHTTELGYCVHDFSMLPCTIHGDCINCDDLVCKKGESPEKEAGIRFQRDETRELLESARSGVEDKEYGADRWVQHQERSLQRLELLCKLLDDQEVLPGAIIRLSGEGLHFTIEDAGEERCISESTLPQVLQRIELRCLDDSTF